ncbi:MAG TPA: CinA family protein [Chloroflexi bacterium]|nr:CinA family protein [Chloroflexota bacterium]
MRSSTTERLAVVVGELLGARGMTLGLAESCTGGLISHWITNVPGSSAYYLGSVTAYATAIKISLLGVPRDVLNRYGAVSEPTVLAMARGARCVLGADIALAVTGIAGPGGGTDEKPVGLVFIALADAGNEWVEKHIWSGARLANKIQSAEAALALLHQYLLGQPV